jgi:vanillate O-demethylase monooxygenase subunit
MRAEPTGPAIAADIHMDARAEGRLFTSLRQFWLPVAYADEVADAPVPVTLLGERLVLVRYRAGIRAFADLCPHRGAQVSLGRLAEDRLMCAYHGWRFDDEGRCTLIPAVPDQRVPPRARLKRYSCVESAGLIWVCPDGEARFAPPTFPEFGDAAFRVLKVPTYDWRCGAHRRIENFVDLAHIPWVHDGVLGDSSQPETPAHEVWRTDSAVAMSASFSELVNDKSRRVAGDLAAGTMITSDHQWRINLPVSLWWRQEFADGVFGAFLAASPIDADHCRSFTFLFRTFGLDEDDEEYIRFQLEIAEADRPVSESQHPEDLPYDLTAELHIRGADRMSVEYRRWLKELADQYSPDGA